MHTVERTCEHGEKAPICNPGRELSPETELAEPWFGIQPPECVQNVGRYLAVKGHSGEVS